jgi:hypothetical protein
MEEEPKEKKKPTCEIRCLICKKKWGSDQVDDPPYWLVVISICHLCYVKMLEEFEKQFPRRYLPAPKKIRVEEKRSEWDHDDAEAEK